MLTDRYGKEIIDGSKVAIARLSGDYVNLHVGIVLRINNNPSGFKLKVRLDTEAIIWANFCPKRVIAL